MRALSQEEQDIHHAIVELFKVKHASHVNVNVILAYIDWFYEESVVTRIYYALENIGLITLDDDDEVICALNNGYNPIPLLRGGRNE